MQRGAPADGAHHLHAGALAVGALDVDDLVALAHAEVDRLLRELVQLAHRRHRGVAHVEPALDQVAQLQQAHAQPVAAGFRPVDEAADRQVVQDAVGGGRMQARLFADLLQRDGFLAGGQHVDQREHALDHLDDRRGRNVGLGFSHGQRGWREPVAILLGEIGWRLPAAVDQHFVRREARLVVHLGAARRSSSRGRRAAGPACAPARSATARCRCRSSAPGSGS